MMGEKSCGWKLFHYNLSLKDYKKAEHNLPTFGPSDIYPSKAKWIVFGTYNPKIGATYDHVGKAIFDNGEETNDLEKILNEIESHDCSIDFPEFRVGRSKRPLNVTLTWTVIYDGTGDCDPDSEYITVTRALKNKKNE